MEQARTRHSGQWIKLSILLFFLGGLATFFIFGGGEWLSLAALKTHRAALLQYTEQNYVLMLLLCMAIYTLSTALSIPGAVLLSLAVGLLFGRWVGTALIVFSATLGAMLVFLAARYLFAEAAQWRAGGFIKKIIAGFQENAFHYLLFLRLVPLFPFWLVNLAPAFTLIKLRTYVAATVIGVIPGSFIFANLGQSLGRIESLRQLVTGDVLLALALLGVFALLPVLIKRFRKP